AAFRRSVQRNRYRAAPVLAFSRRAPCPLYSHATAETDLPASVDAANLHRRMDRHARRSRARSRSRAARISGQWSAVSATQFNCLLTFHRVSGDAGPAGLDPTASDPRTRTLRLRL